MNQYTQVYDKLLMEGLPETVADKAAKLITERGVFAESGCFCS